MGSPHLPNPAFFFFNLFTLILVCFWKGPEGKQMSCSNSSVMLNRCPCIHSWISSKPFPWTGPYFFFVSSCLYFSYPLWIPGSIILVAFLNIHQPFTSDLVKLQHGYIQLLLPSIWSRCSASHFMNSQGPWSFHYPVLHSHLQTPSLLGPSHLHSDSCSSSHRKQMVFGGKGVGISPLSNFVISLILISALLLLLFLNAFFKWRN